MRMMKNKENQIITVIGVDHGYGNLKTCLLYTSPSPRD